MSWSYEKSIKRIQEHLDAMGEISVEKLVREADLSNLLTETTCREIFGAHVYVGVTNFNRLASDRQMVKDDYARLVRAVHIFQREVARIVEEVDAFDAVRIHFQGPRVHALVYRPIDNTEEIATRAVLLMLTLRDFARAVFNPAFPTYGDFVLAGGADIGSAIGTRNGVRSDRELLFIGSPANHGAKVIGSGATLRLTERIHEALPDNLKGICEEVEGCFQLVDVDGPTLSGLLETHRIRWTRATSEKRIADDKEAFPIADIACGSAETLINIDGLSITNNKRVMAASVFADVSGFTAFIDAARDDAAKLAALRVFHGIRKEMAKVVTSDFGGVRVQFQGDRVQALFHLPADNEPRIATKAVEAAIGLQSSMEHTLKTLLPDAGPLGLAVGVDMGSTLVTKLGTRAHRDRICLGENVERAARCQEVCGAGQIGITTAVYDALDDDLKPKFAWNEGRMCYVASGLTVEKAEPAANGAALYADGASVHVRSGEAGITILNRPTRESRPVVPARSWLR
jgi:class 3 adenylate cyclase